MFLNVMDKSIMHISHLITPQNIKFNTARTMAKAEARRFLTDPMILSWLNRITGQRSPDVDCCEHDGKEAWEIYAESRGGTLKVELGDDYVFIFGESSLDK